MKRVLLITVVVMCSVMAVSAWQQKTGTLKGKIEGAKGKPIADADVRAISSRTHDVKETKTDQAGAYSFELEPDDYTVSFDAEGFQGGTLRDMQQVEEGKETKVKTIQLQKARRTSLLRGAVFDSDGRSLAGVRLKLIRVLTADEMREKKKVDSLSMSYTTNNRGEFAFRLPSARARYQVTAALSGYKPETKTVDVNEDEAVPLSFSLESLKK
ncbi:MAG TPA: carboxypeptidase-like regulatory domain-containing protein [Blastocatellia bacterium]